MIWEKYVDAAGEVFDELAAYCLATAVSDGGEGFPLKNKCRKSLKTKRPKEKRKRGKVVD